MDGLVLDANLEIVIHDAIFMVNAKMVPACVYQDGTGNIAP